MEYTGIFNWNVSHLYAYIYCVIIQFNQIIFIGSYLYNQGDSVRTAGYKQARYTIIITVARFVVDYRSLDCI